MNSFVNLFFEVLTKNDFYAKIISVKSSDFENELLARILQSWLLLKILFHKGGHNYASSCY